MSIAILGALSTLALTACGSTQETTAHANTSCFFAGAITGAITRKITSALPNIRGLLPIALTALSP